MNTATFSIEEFKKEIVNDYNGEVKGIRGFESINDLDEIQDDEVRLWLSDVLNAKLDTLKTLEKAKNILSVEPGTWTAKIKICSDNKIKTDIINGKLYAHRVTWFNISDFSVKLLYDWLNIMKG